MIKTDKQISATSKSLKNGDIIKNSNKIYKRTLDITRHDTVRLVGMLYSKKYINQKKYIIEINKILTNRIKSGRCTQLEIINLKHLHDSKKKNIVKSINSNITTTTTTTNITNVHNNLVIDIKYKINKLKADIYKVTGVEFGKLNRTECVEDKAHVYYDQILASLQCISNLICAKNDLKYSRYNMLTAETQSGKTGVMRNIIYLLETYDKLREYLNIDFNSSLLITSMCDNANKEQLKVEMSHGQCRQDNQHLLCKNGIMHNPDLVSWIRKNKTSELKNCIIFIDESHLASHIGSAINSFLLINNINLNGTTNLSNNNLFVFTVSATPYEEHVGNLLYKKKNTIELSHGPGYKGLKYFMNNGKFKQSFDLSTTEGELLFKDELKTFNNKIGYYIVRISRNTKPENLIPKFDEFDEFDTLTYYEKDKDAINDKLKTAPIKPTLIFIKEKMKQSYQLDKSNIVMLFDRTTANDSSYRTSFIVQSFAGRSCGYHNYDFVVYTDIENVKLHLDYIKNKHNIPKCRHILKKTYTTNSSNITILNFKLFSDIFIKMVKLRNKNNKCDNMVNMIQSAYPDNEILIKYKQGKANYNNTCFYTKNNTSYDTYITNAYNNDGIYSGKTNLEYFYGKSLRNYKINEHVFAIYLDIPNENVIIIDRIIGDKTTTIKKINPKYSFINSSKNQTSSYSEYNNTSKINNFKLNKKSNISGEGYVYFNNNKITIYLDTNKNLVLPKKSIVETEFMTDYIKKHIVYSDIKIPCHTIENIKNTLEYFCNIISPSITIDDLKTRNNSKFIDLLPHLL